MKYVFAFWLVLVNLSACTDRGFSQGEVANAPVQDKGIVGGQNATADDNRSDQVVLITGEDANNKSYTCSGTLIESDTVLTAAHCVGKIDTMKVTFGLSPLNEETTMIAKVKTYVKHRRFKKDQRIRNDIALIQLDVDLPSYISLAILPWQRDRNESPKSGDSIKAFGFGVTSGVLKNGGTDGKTAGIMRETSLEVLKNSEAGDVFVADQTKGHGICSGDSGGPAYIEGNIVAGVTSHAITDDPDHPELADNDVCNYQSVFTDVLYYKNWILGALKRLHQEK